MAVPCGVLVIDGDVSTAGTAVREVVPGMPAGVLGNGVASALTDGEDAAKLQLTRLAIINPPNKR